jgi:hypothetical protein
MNPLPEPKTANPIICSKIKGVLLETYCRR